MNIQIYLYRTHTHTYIYIYIYAEDFVKTMVSSFDFPLNSNQSNESSPMCIHIIIIVIMYYIPPHLSTYIYIRIYIYVRLWIPLNTYNTYYIYMMYIWYIYIWYIYIYTLLYTYIYDIPSSYPFVEHLLWHRQEPDSEGFLQKDPMKPQIQRLFEAQEQRVLRKSGCPKSTFETAGNLHGNHWKTYKNIEKTHIVWF